MLPTPAELRELSRRFREAAVTVSSDLKSRLAAHALALAQVAEQIERETPMGEFVRNANIERYERLLAEALDERTRTTVEALLNGEQKVIGKKLREIRAWRMRAEELRTVADEFSVPSVQQALLELAVNYESLADYTEARLVGRRSSSNDVA